MSSLLDARVFPYPHLDSSRACNQQHRDFGLSEVELWRPGELELTTFGESQSGRRPPADALAGRSVLFKWPAIGWCIAKITERNVDARVYKKIEDQRVKVNFYLFFEMNTFCPQYRLQ